MADFWEWHCGKNKRIAGRRVEVGGRKVWEFTCVPWPKIAERFRHAEDTDGAYWAFLDHLLGRATWACEGGETAERSA
jgi:hypothetical protein